MDYICLLLLGTDFMQSDKLITKVATIFACFTLVQLSACVNTLSAKKEQNYLVATGEITENADRFIGKSVLVRNDASQIVGTRNFILDKDRLFEGEPILVINISGISLQFANDKTPEMLVEGKVELLNIDSIEQQYSLNLDSNYHQYEGKPVIIATSVILSPDPEDITANPEIYYNKPLAIKGEVDDIEDYGIFEIDEEKAFGGEDLVVLQPEFEIKLNEEQTIIAYGVVRQFIVEELERDYAFGWNSAIQTEIEAKYGKKPVLVTDKIEIIR